MPRTASISFSFSIAKANFFFCGLKFVNATSYKFSECSLVGDAYSDVKSRNTYFIRIGLEDVAALYVLLALFQIGLSLFASKFLRLRASKMHFGLSYDLHRVRMI